ncbi:hypothetical protein [Brunnivagina elsteri]|uniref:hypothetical protein n=1 Tax=Brunnivagina elsteri TaxID=1247191 RepID=UPI001FE3E073|nr:hypothetical protein [Calothrix elsteri]
MIEGRHTPPCCTHAYGSLHLWFWDKPNPEKSVIKTSQIIHCDMLAMLAQADLE